MSSPTEILKILYIKGYVENLIKNRQAEIVKMFKGVINSVDHTQYNTITSC